MGGRMIANAGEHVTDEAGNYICRVKNDLHYGMTIRPSDFHEFAEGETPWVPGQVYDKRCIRLNGEPFMRQRNAQICINGEWRP